MSSTGACRPSAQVSSNSQTLATGVMSLSLFSSISKPLRRLKDVPNCFHFVPTLLTNECSFIHLQPTCHGGRGPKNLASSNFMHLGPTPTNWFRSDSHARGRWFNPSNAHSAIKSLARRTGRRRVARSFLVPTSTLRSRVPTGACKCSFAAPPCLWGRFLAPHPFGPR
jgi:hypothetical protein